MFEQHHEPLLPAHVFIRRLIGFGGLALGLTLTWWTVGILGYHFLAGLSWVDAILNSAMIVGGMGPVDRPLTSGGKLFAGLYALYCGLAVILVAGVILAPIAHRILHRFHVDSPGA